MTDRELLEAAAKAAISAGINLTQHHGIWYDSDYDVPWNPLTDDGDALRLAVKLRIQITPGTYNKDEFTAFLAGGGEAHEHWSTMQDEYAATRRAITRAAASTASQNAGEEGA